MVGLDDWNGTLYDPPSIGHCMKKDKDEQILVFKTELLHKLGYFQGLKAEVSYLEPILDAAFFMDRVTAEQEPAFKQIIPYVALQYDGQLYCYKRSKWAGEKRLHHLASIGFGGHIKHDDDKGLFDTLFRLNKLELGQEREVAEEVDIRSPYQIKFVGLINDDSNEVGKVHFGISSVFLLDKPDCEVRERELIQAKFQTFDEVTAQLDDFETWSQILFNGHFRK